jgi:putative ABC transport system substrate-binding protein
MRRRDFITLAGSVVAAWPLTAFGKVQRIAIVLPSQPVTTIAETNDEPLWHAVFSELRRLGYIEGQNLLIERYSGGERGSPNLTRDVVSRNPDLIIPVSTNLTLKFKAATTSIPIVGVFGLPIEGGIVPSLARPGGNITGAATDVGIEQWFKRIQLLQQVAPQATRLAFLETRAGREQFGPKEGEGGVTWVGPPLNYPIDEAEYRRVFAGLATDGADGIVVSDEEETWVKRRLIVELAEKTRLPAIYPFKEFVQAGGLMSYGIDVPDVGRRVANMVDQILKGAKPSDIPVFQPTKFELVINLRTAKELGITVPATLLVATDEVFE